MPNRDKSRELKLYYWDDLGESTVLETAFALASSKEHAVELVVDDAREWFVARRIDQFEEQLEALRAELLAKRAHIHYKPVGFVRTG